MQTEAPTSRPPGPQMGRFSRESTSSKEYWIRTEKEAATRPSCCPGGLDLGTPTAHHGGGGSTMPHGSMDPSQIIHSNCTVGRGGGVGWGFLFSQQLLLHHQSRVAIFSRSRCVAAVLAQDDDRNVGWGVTFPYIFRGSRMSIS